MQEKLLELVKGKKVQLCCHWDADGVTSGALLYHIIKDHCTIVKTLSKGKPFIIEPNDLIDEAEIVVCADIHPSEEILNRNVIYVDHHPSNIIDKCLLAIHDEHIQSCSILIYDKLVKNKSNPYYVFLALLGYFGDAGDKEKIPEVLRVNAMNQIPELMEKNKSYFSDDYYLTIQKYVSALNTGKRKNWCGNIPLELLKCISSHEPFIYNGHPLAQTLQGYRRELRDLYSKEYKIEDYGKYDIVQIECPQNIQGVIAAQKIKNKPIIVMNKLDGEIIGSMRVPDDLDFDAGKFLDTFNGKIPTFLGGGHTKAGGFSFVEEHLDAFLNLLRQ